MIEAVSQAEKERLEREKMERALKDKRCPTCDQKVYPESVSHFYSKTKIIILRLSDL
jgi:hypothetical protein